MNEMTVFAHDAASGVARRRGGYTLAIVAALTCPCHLPVLALLLAGTVAGAFLAEHLALVIAAASAIFLVSIVFAMRLLGARNERPAQPSACERHANPGR